MGSFPVHRSNFYLVLSEGTCYKGKSLRVSEETWSAYSRKDTRISDDEK